MEIKHLCVCAALAALLGSPAVQGKRKEARSEGPVISTSALWEQPVDIRERSLYYGPGGERDKPGHSFRFVSEDKKGSNPKFDVVDENGVKWKVKLGNEAQPEVVATRLLWAVGYYADEDYLIPVLHVAGLPGHLSRGANLIQPDGSVLNARLKRMTGRKKIGTWSWRKSPFEHTREFDGLRVMMALIDNWDVKDENNEIIERHGKRVYEVSDLGASFGTTGVLLDKDKAKNNLESFQNAKFISHVTADHVSFGTPAAPSIPYVFNPVRYETRVRLRWIGKDIPNPDVKWIARYLAQLSNGQIRDAFRAAGYSPAEIDEFSKVLIERIRELTAL